MSGDPRVCLLCGKPIEDLGEASREFEAWEIAVIRPSCRTS
jgi:hypothetical protein